MNELETRYRRALGWYPRPWREAHADAVAGTLLDRAEHEGRGAPRRGEIANLRAHGLAAHARRLPDLVNATIRDRAATGALSLGAAIAVSAILTLEADPTRFPLSEILVGSIATFGPFTSPLVLVYLAWLVALALALVGRTTAARATALATLPLTVAGRLVADALGMDLRPTWTFLALLSMLAIMVAAGRPIRSRRDVGWAGISLGLATGLVAVLHLAHPRMHAFQDPSWIEVPDLVAWSPIAVGAVAAVLLLFGGRDWAGAVLLIGAPWVAVSLFGDSSDILKGAAIWAVVIAAAMLAPTVMLAARGLRIRLGRE